MLSQALRRHRCGRTRHAGHHATTLISLCSARLEPDGQSAGGPPEAIDDHSSNKPTAIYPACSRSAPLGMLNAGRVHPDALQQEHDRRHDARAAGRVHRLSACAAAKLEHDHRSADGRASRGILGSTSSTWLTTMRRHFDHRRLQRDRHPRQDAGQVRLLHAEFHRTGRPKRRVHRPALRHARARGKEPPGRRARAPWTSGARAFRSRRP